MFDIFLVRGFLAKFGRMKNKGFSGGSLLETGAYNSADAALMQNFRQQAGQYTGSQPFAI